MALPPEILQSVITELRREQYLGKDTDAWCHVIEHGPGPETYNQLRSTNNTSMLRLVELLVRVDVRDDKKVIPKAVIRKWQKILKLVGQKDKVANDPRDKRGPIGPRKDEHGNVIVKRNEVPMWFPTYDWPWSSRQIQSELKKSRMEMERSDMETLKTIRPEVSMWEHPDWDFVASTEGPTCYVPFRLSEDQLRQLYRKEIRRRDLREKTVDRPAYPEMFDTVQLLLAYGAYKGPGSGEPGARIILQGILTNDSVTFVRTNKLSDKRSEEVRDTIRGMPAYRTRAGVVFLTPEWAGEIGAKLFSKSLTCEPAKVTPSMESDAAWYLHFLYRKQPEFREAFDGNRLLKGLPAQDPEQPVKGTSKQYQAYVGRKYSKLVMDDPGEHPEKPHCEYNPGRSVLVPDKAQRFLAASFSPNSSDRGRLVVHSVGSGKTCAAILVSASFIERGYKVLWVTRSAIKNDVIKNHTTQICNELLKKRVARIRRFDGEEAARRYIDSLPSEPNEVVQFMKRELDTRWRNMSYRMFSNALEGKNSYFRGFKGDHPLDNTLVIIDEAHNLFHFPRGMGKTEIPDTLAIKRGLQSSSSVRVLLLTATPIVESPLSLTTMFNMMSTHDVFEGYDMAIQSPYATTPGARLQQVNHNRETKLGLDLLQLDVSKKPDDSDADDDDEKDNPFDTSDLFQQGPVKVQNHVKRFWERAFAMVSYLNVSADYSRFPRTRYQTVIVPSLTRFQEQLMASSLLSTSKSLVKLPLVIQHIRRIAIWARFERKGNPLGKPRSGDRLVMAENERGATLRSTKSDLERRLRAMDAIVAKLREELAEFKARESSLVERIKTARDKDILRSGLDQVRARIDRIVLDSIPEQEGLAQRIRDQIREGRYAEESNYVFERTTYDEADDMGVVDFDDDDEDAVHHDDEDDPSGSAPARYERAETRWVPVRPLGRAGFVKQKYPSDMYFDRPEFNADKFRAAVPLYGPVVEQFINQVHVQKEIESEQGSGGQKAIVYCEDINGIRAAAGALVADGWSFGMELYEAQRERIYYDEDDAVIRVVRGKRAVRWFPKPGRKSFLVLTRSTLGGTAPITEDVIAAIKSRGSNATFNAPDNIDGSKYGMVLFDRSFTEGVDMPAQHVYLLKTPESTAMMTQIVGRAVRNCGLSNDTFKPGFGWYQRVVRFDVKFRDVGLTVNEDRFMHKFGRPEYAYVTQGKPETLLEKIQDDLLSPYELVAILHGDIRGQVVRKQTNDILDALVRRTNIGERIYEPVMRQLRKDEAEFQAKLIDERQARLDYKQRVLESKRDVEPNRYELRERQAQRVYMQSLRRLAREGGGGVQAELHKYVAEHIPKRGTSESFRSLETDEAFIAKIATGMLNKFGKDVRFMGTVRDEESAARLTLYFVRKVVGARLVGTEAREAKARKREHKQHKAMRKTEKKLGKQVREFIIDRFGRERRAVSADEIVAEWQSEHLKASKRTLQAVWHIVDTYQQGSRRRRRKVSQTP